MGCYPLSPALTLVVGIVFHALTPNVQIEDSQRVCIAFYNLGLCDGANEGVAGARDCPSGIDVDQETLPT